MTFAEIASDRYQPRPVDASPETFAGRVAVCAACVHRRGQVCGPAAQLATVLARNPAQVCPARHWPGDPPPDPDSGLRQPAAGELPREAPAGGVAVVVTSHNYGRFLGAALESLRAQTVAPAEIVVVADACTDNTAEIARASGVRVIEIDARNVAQARGAGLAATRSPFVVFLDADDYLGETYLAGTLAGMADPTVGIVTTDLWQFGTVSGRIRHDEHNLERQNWAHAGSLVRRTALEAAADAFTLRPLRATHHDWLLWRAVVRAGWRVAHAPDRESTRYHYRRHPTSQTADMVAGAATYYDLAGLAFAPVTLFLPLAGRVEGWPRLLDFLDRQTWPRDQLRVVVCDTSQDPAFGAQVRADLGALNLPDLRIYRQRVAPAGIADAPREAAAAAVRSAMVRIYSRAIQEAATEYLWILEDDVRPPVDTLDRLLRHFDHHVASVSAAYRSRHGARDWVAWAPDRHPYTDAPSRGVAPVGGNGWGCVVLRTSVARGIPIRTDGPTADYDPNFYHHLGRSGWRALCDWATVADHD